MSAARNVLVAGIGNVFLGDDGFGVEVVRRLTGTAMPATADVADYGIRGVHLAYELLDGRYDTLIMVDAVPVDGPPGTLAVIEAADGPAGDAAAIDGHGLHPDAVLRLLSHLGGGVERVLVVGCRPAVLDEVMGLSEPVAAAVDEAVRLVAELAWQEAAGTAEKETTDA
ncbi:hydrogenase maturation protease [Nonomuraea spiralis]|uniref:Hydrogenase maturation protease n=1 Tax=Nonomuraea spiralis TaxID=46182 RepID=A0ABV5II62_9ACTN|nr:hydrogenase maturation protease [Nonomuraea spiralis]GGS98064.1 peptidase M52 [Nonomuraea spiralis]